MATADGLREHVLWLLDGGHAHLGFDAAVADLPAELRGRTPGGLPYSPWQLVEHSRIAQRDILDFCREPGYESPSWPEGFWPDGPAPPDDGAWQRSLAAFRADARALRALIADPRADLLAPLPAGPPYTLLRQALLVADHNAYHVGQLVVVRRMLGAWSD